MAKTRKRNKQLAGVETDKLSVGAGILSLVIPPVGVFHYFNNKDSNPSKANTAIALATIGFVSNILFYRYNT